MGLTDDEQRRQERSRIFRAMPGAAVVLAVVLVAGTAIVRDFRQERAQAAARLEAIAELRATQVQAWYDRHMAFARFLDDSAYLAGLFTQWQEHGDAEAGGQLLARAIDSRHADDADSALVTDAAGRVLAREHPAQRAGAEELAATVVRAVAARGATGSTIDQRAGTEIELRLDIAIPLLRTGVPARGALILRVDPRRSLFPILSAWPVPSATGEAVLWDHTGDRLVNISALRHDPASVGSVSVPFATSTLPAVRLARGERPQGVAAQVTDVQGTAVLCAGRRVTGTDWWLVAKMDMDEVDAPVWKHARETLLAAALALLGAALGSRLLEQRRVVHRAERERREQRQRLHALALQEAIARSAGEAICAKDPDGRYMFCNPAAAELMGLPADEVLGRTDEELLAADVAARVREDDRRALRGELVDSHEEVLPTPRGPVPVLSTRRPLVDAEGNQLGLLVVSRDMTAMRDAQRALRDSEEHFRTVVSVLNEGIVVSDAAGRVVSSNPAAARLVGGAIREGQEAASLAASWTVQFADGRPMAPQERPTARVLAGEGAVHGVVTHVTFASGERFVFEVGAVPLVGTDGTRSGVVTTFFDVTVQHRMEEDLRRHRDQLETEVAQRTRELVQANEALAGTLRFNQQITDAIPGLVTYWDMSLRCQFANRTYLDSIGRSADQVIGRTKAEIHGEDHADGMTPRLLLAMRGQSQVLEHEVTRDPASPRVFLVHFQPAFGPGGEVAGAYMMAFDISALKRAESALTRTNEALARARDEAETANRAKSAFLANMSHEIRTPLNGILGLAYLLARDPRDALQRERLAKIGEAGRHLLQIINDVLDLSKIEAGKLTLEQTDFSLDTLLATACDMVGERAQAKGLELVVDTEHLPRRLNGDPTRLSQMILNLLSNAVKFTDQGWIRLKGELLDDVDGRVHLRIEVHDTGMGIPPERQAELFNDFEQGDNTTTRRFGGTGLGLSLTRNLAAAMGGQVGVASSPGAGSTFWFTAWLRHAGHDDDATALAPMSSMRLLLVDDLPEASSVIAGYLRHMGLQVDACDSGDAAVQRVEARMAHGRPYDLMLVDSSTRCAGGEPTLVRLHALMGDGMPPCVLLASSADGLDGDRALGVRVDAVVDKPVTASALHDVMARLLLRAGGSGADAAVVRDASEDRVRARHAGRRVLLAEDNIINRLIARELLSHAGLVVEEAENGAIALELASTQHWDLILMDMQMPVMDGLDAARAIRAAGAVSVPIVAMTANAFLEDRAACLAAGMNDHVAKPVNPAALYYILMRWLPAAQAPRV